MTINALAAVLALGSADLAWGQGASALNELDRVLTYTHAISGGRETVPPVVIQFTASGPETVASMTEDLAVMGRLIEKALEGGLGEDERPVKMGVKMLLTGSGRSVRPMYVEGLGALFMIKVNFPLLPPPQVEKKPEPKVSSEWEEARKEIKGTATGREGSWRELDAGGAEYREEQVEALKKALLTVLQQAANIRQLKPEEYVAISVFGSDGRDGMPVAIGGGYGTGGYGTAGVRIAATPRGMNAAGAGGTGGSSSSAPRQTGSADAKTPPTPAARGGGARSAQPGSVPPTTGALASNTAKNADRRATTEHMQHVIVTERSRDGAQGTVLTLRVKKADVDAFAKGDLDFEAFRSRALLNLYVGSGHGVASVNSWIQQRPR